MHGKYKNGKVWGGTIGAVGHKVSPKKLDLRQQLKLPPLGGKPVFGDAKIGRLTISEADIPKLQSSTYKRNSQNDHFYTGGMSQDGIAIDDSKPNTAHHVTSLSQS